MKIIKIISSPRLDYTLAPDEFRRYSNQIIGWNLFLFSIFFFFFQAIVFYELPFFKTAIAIYLKKQSVIDSINLPFFQVKAIFTLIISVLPASYLTLKITKPVNRVQIKEGNFIDKDDEVFTNLQNNFARNTLDKNICLIRRGEIDYNKQKQLFKKNCLIANDIYLPSSILELSFIVRGEAGSGKTVFTDRLVKETIQAGHKVVLHNIKGDEFKKLNGYGDFYLIEPWNLKGGYAINFLSLLARDREEDRNAYIYSFVKSFLGKSSKQNEFFDGSAIEVLFAIVKKVVEDEIKKGNNQAGLKDIVNLWVSFQANTEDKEIDLTNPSNLKKAMDNKIESLEKIKKILQEKNPTQADLIDSNNAKTSLCILATCTKTIKKFEVLAKFWGDREKTKSLDLVKWLNNPKDRKVLMLSNSNLYVAEAEAYISAIINLLTMFVINPEYEPKNELHFILDEFVQLSSIDLKQFMKLPDVGRGKKVRTKVVLQRSSQIKEVFDVNPESFAGAFQNKIWARMATDDFSNLSNELGKQEVRITKSSASNNAQGLSSTNSTENKPIDVVNASDMQKELGPVERNGEFQGVRILLNFSQFKRIAVATFPPVAFPKKSRSYKFKSVAGNSPTLPEPADSTQDSTEQGIAYLQEESTSLQVVAGPTDHQEHRQEQEPMTGAFLEVVAHTALPEPVGIALQVAELMENLETHNKNNDTVQVITSTEEKKELIKALLQKNKNKNKELDL